MVNSTTAPVNSTMPTCVEIPGTSDLSGYNIFVHWTVSGLITYVCHIHEYVYNYVYMKSIYNFMVGRVGQVTLQK